MENGAALWDALRGPANEVTDARIQLFDAPWDFLTKELEGELFPDMEPSWADDHAGRLETAMMLHLAPKLVGQPPAPVPFVPRPYDVFPTPVDAVPSTGAILDSRGMTAELGRRSTEAIVGGMARGDRAGARENLGQHGVHRRAVVTRLDVEHAMTHNREHGVRGRRAVRPAPES